MVVVASLIPTRRGDRVKTDRRDSEALARLHRAGELTAVWVPDEKQEAMRGLTRVREDMKHLERQSKQRLNAFFAAPWPPLRVGQEQVDAGPLALAGENKVRPAGAADRDAKIH